MDRIKYIVSALTALTLSACGSSGIDSNAPVERQAAEIVADATPEQAAERVVRWMSRADIADRRFARRLTRQIASIYDTMPGPESHRFVMAIDSVRSRLPLRDQARAFAVATTPGRLGRMMRLEQAEEELVRHVRDAYGADSVALAEFNAAYSGSDEPIPDYLKDEKK